MKKIIFWCSAAPEEALFHAIEDAIFISELKNFLFWAMSSLNLLIRFFENRVLFSISILLLSAFLTKYFLSKESSWQFHSKSTLILKFFSCSKIFLKGFQACFVWMNLYPLTYDTFLKINLFAFSLVNFLFLSSKILAESRLLLRLYHFCLALDIFLDNLMSLCLL